ncbi:MAG: DNA-deoxyinosine glycosylase [Polaromonas sp.]|nr:DNA-deoxyinosine glycosylase [Polaromonas sp.]
MLTGLAPLVSPQTRLLILGSFPGLASLAAQQYYGHPQNQFWKILQAIWPSSPLPAGVRSYQNRSDWLLDKQLGVWDVYAACERDGSLDSDIRRPVLNDFAGLLQLCPQLEAIAHNGGESFRQARKIAPVLATACVPGLPIAVHQLPSTSPANASWSFERKLAAWREVVARHGLV